MICDLSFVIIHMFRDAWSRSEFSVCWLVFPRAKAEQWVFGQTSLYPYLWQMLNLIHNLTHSWFMSSCSFDTVASSFLFQLYGTTCMAPYCRGMLKKEMVSMLSAVLCSILIMTDVMIPWRFWSSKNIFHLLLNTALKWDYHPVESAEPLLSNYSYLCSWYFWLCSKPLEIAD